MSKKELCDRCGKSEVLVHLLNISQSYWRLCCECAEETVAFLGRKRPGPPPAVQLPEGRLPEDGA